MLTVDVRDASLAPVARVAGSELEWREEWLGVGGWLLALPGSTDGLDPDIASATVTAIEALAEPGSGIIVTDTDTGETVLSGSTTPTAGAEQVAGTRRIGVESDGRIADELVFAGTDDMQLLRDRICLPSPGTGIVDDLAVTRTDARSGPASYVLLGYLGANTATVDRRLPIELTDVGPLGVEVSTEARFDVLLEQLQHVAQSGGLTFRIRQTGRRLYFEVAEQRDRSGDVVFSAGNGNITKAELSASPTVANVVYVAGQGEGAARMVRVRMTAAARAGTVRRIEAFLDRRDLSTADLLDRAGDQWLAENTGEPAIEFEPVVADDGYRFGVDYRVGDLVRLDLPGVESTQRIISARTRVAGDETTRILTAGTVAPVGDAALLRTVESLRERIRHIETRY